MRTMQVLLMLISVQGLIGCETLHKLGHRWEGRHIDEVVQARGAPSAVTELSDGRKVYTYELKSGSSSTLKDQTVTTTNSSCKVLLTVNQAGIVEQQSKTGDCY